MEIKEKILEGASELFYKYGIRSVSMDDIARSLSVSKKTIYHYYKDKDEIVELALLRHISEAKNEFEKIFNSAYDPVKELRMLTWCMRQNYKNANPALIFDIQKFHSQAWEHMKSFKCTHVKNLISANLKRGIEMGYYRQEIDIEILAILRMGQVELAFDSRFYPSSQFDFRTIQIQLWDHFIYGIVTEKGRQLIDKYNSENNDNN